MGRPGEFTIELGELICERIASGESLRTICADEGFPDKSTIFRWLGSNEAFRDQYARAKSVQAEAMAEELLDIADDATNDWMDKRFGETEVRVIDNEAIQRSKLRVDTRKWLMSKMLPKKYGDKVEHEHSGKVTLEALILGADAD